MGRPISSDLQNLLDLDACETQTTLSLYLADGVTEYHFATAIIKALDGDNYTADLNTADDINQSISSATDRVTVSIQNIDKVFGAVATAETLAKATAVIGRLHTDIRGVLPDVWTELFRGEALPLPLTENEVKLEIVSDLIASGYCVSHWNLAEVCQFVFKHLGTCGYSGGETLCNKRRFSLDGCKGRSNEHRFGGMEYPEIQRPGTPTGGSSGGGSPPTCFTGDTSVDLTRDTEIDFETLYRNRDQYLGRPVLSFDDDGNIVDDILIDLHIHLVSELLVVEFFDGTRTRVTAEHPYYLTESKEFVPIGELKPGSVVLGRSGDGFTIRSIKPTRYPMGIRVYNLTTAKYHHYFADGKGVHNSKPPLPD